MITAWWGWHTSYTARKTEQNTLSLVIIISGSSVLGFRLFFSVTCTTLDPISDKVSFGVIRFTTKLFYSKLLLLILLVPRFYIKTHINGIFLFYCVLNYISCIISFIWSTYTFIYCIFSYVSFPNN